MGHGSGSEFSPQSWIRLRPYLHDWLFRRPPESRSSFSEDVPLIVQLSRNSRRLGDVSACGASVVISSLESYWTLLVSGLLQPGNESTSFSQLAPCFCHEWIYPFSSLELMRMLSFLTLLTPEVRLRMRSFPVALHRSWVRLDSEALVRWSSEIRQDLFWWRAHERLELVYSLGRVSPVDLWSDSSNVGWALVSTLFGVPSGP